MVFILVLLTVAVCLLAEWYVLHRRWKARETAWVLKRTGPEPELYFHPGHTWARVTPDGLVEAGASDLATNFVGDLERIELPRKGRRLRQGEPAWTLVSEQGRRLPLAMPVGGKVLAVNHKLFEDPKLAQRSPYDEGWIVCARSRRAGDGLGNLFRPEAAKKWLDAIRATLMNRFHPAMGKLAFDGGEWFPSFGDRLNEDEWVALKDELFSTGQTIPEDDQT